MSKTLTGVMLVVTALFLLAVLSLVAMRQAWQTEVQRMRQANIWLEDRVLYLQSRERQLQDQLDEQQKRESRLLLQVEVRREGWSPGLYLSSPSKGWRVGAFRSSARREKSLALVLGYWAQSDPIPGFPCDYALALALDQRAIELQTPDGKIRKLFALADKKE